MLLQDYFERYDVPAVDRRIPAVFTSNSYIVGEVNILDGFEKLVRNSLNASSEQVRIVSEVVDKGCDAEELSGFDCLSLLTITVSALVDFVNPCSMAILFFLIANLKVNYKDLFDLAAAYGSKPGEPNWNPNCDIDGDDRVGYKDLFTLAANNGKNAHKNQNLSPPFFNDFEVASKAETSIRLNHSTVFFLSLLTL